MSEPGTTGVLLEPSSRAGHSRFVELIVETQPATVVDALALAARLASSGATPGRGETAQVWEALATLGALDLGFVRAVEPHLDAVAILEQAGHAVAPGSWGVFAAEGGDDPLVATKTEAGWVLDGTKVWCSLAAILDHALITAKVGDDRGLFAVDLRMPGVTVIEGAWHARGLTEIPSGPVRFSAVPAAAVGEPGWYLSRAGFSWGGIGVAACWFGGAVGLARTLYEASIRRPDDQVLLMHLGAVDEALQSARRAVVEAAGVIDAAASSVGDDSNSRLLAKRVRATVARAVDEVISRSGRALGPAPLAHDDTHAKRVADLTLYVRQYHAERDEISLGRALVAEGGAPW